MYERTKKELMGMISKYRIMKVLRDEKIVTVKGVAEETGIPWNEVYRCFKKLVGQGALIRFESALYETTDELAKLMPYDIDEYIESLERRLKGERTKEDVVTLEAMQMYYDTLGQRIKSYLKKVEGNIPFRKLHQHLSPYGYKADEIRKVLCDMEDEGSVMIEWNGDKIKSVEWNWNLLREEINLNG